MTTLWRKRIAVTILEPLKRSICEGKLKDDLGTEEDVDWFETSYIHPMLTKATFEYGRSKVIHFLVSGVPR
jgi:hypothetical protein